MVKGTRLLAAWCFALLGSGCTKAEYVIGALCSAVDTCPDSGGASGAGGSGVEPGGAGAGGPAAGGRGGSSGSGAAPPGPLTIDLTGSGVERLPEALFGAQPSHFLIADDATASAWPARVGDGFDVLDDGGLALGQPSPFADPGRVLQHAGATTFGADSSWAETSAGALALEAVFRGEPGATLLRQRDADGGLELLLDASGRLNWRLSDGNAELLVTSEPLVADAWHHCLALFDASQAVAQIFCNGQAGSAAPVPSGFAVATVAANATLGGASPARLRWAELARWQAASWGPRGAWTDLARERFARLVGTYAQGSREPLPFADVRASGAYVDMTPSDEPTLRRLHPVGKDWPRVVCRPTRAEARLCGLLVEVSSSQPVAPEDLLLDDWSAVELSVAPGNQTGSTGDATLFALTPSALATEHAVERAVPLADGPAVLSLFARAGSAHLLRAEVAGRASATFDLEASTVVESDATLMATAEPWGDGLLRLSFSFEVAAGPGALRLALLGPGGAEQFAGDGSVAAELGEVELRFRSFSTPLPTFGAIQEADHLVYPAGNGNLPAGPWFDFSAEIWLPEAQLLSDAAVLNANFSNRFEQQINLFVSPQQGGRVQFWSIQGDATQWQLSSSAAVTDGLVHQITAGVTPEGAVLTLDDEATSEPAGAFDIGVLDRVEIGTSTSSSGPLTGIVRRIRVTSPP